MAGLIDNAMGEVQAPENRIARSRRAWEERMMHRIEQLKSLLRGSRGQMVADRCGASYENRSLMLPYWDRQVKIAWPALKATYANGEDCPIFDLAMILYYLTTADGSPLAGRWIGFRELPGGVFYNQAFQGYSGDSIARHFGGNPEALVLAASRLGGWKLPDLGDLAFAFQAMPRIRLATVLWLGDEDFPTRASVLFDASSPHYMITDGLALLGGGIAGKLIEACRGTEERG